MTCVSRVAIGAPRARSLRHAHDHALRFRTVGQLLQAQAADEHARRRLQDRADRLLSRPRAQVGLVPEAQSARPVAGDRR